VRTLPLHRLRQQLAAFLVGLLMLVSAAPCTAFAAPRTQAALAAPADPCKAHNPAAPCACAQLACQHAADLGGAFSAPAAVPSAATFHAASIAGFGRTDAPPLPPPRLLL
jgi:hypothetical protein